ncbi:peptide ABC transporter substrate-binding protein [Pseudomonas fragi]|uniref:FecR family protein n=1 Tax=Pseudomonas fragi TaxID=296 RepID=A0A9Q6VNS5_PSEFR|nr:FecR family protein [Pseudomonas fragi]ARQ75521.1 peptide ABC transporter substrate-binding protein [Pseudomonas fragi]NNA87402.1 FecR family protein [Pseudomonas fragi]NNB10992.1 FecR family protein [Pseudomonas fragi]NNB41403.1 FecR family protein [Pseudomonas fragi]QPL33119.1 FecR family protein [Pseudomonas fragi]
MSQARLTEAQNDAITEAAAQWCMRLHEPDCTRQEREAFAVWLNANPLHALEYEAMLEIWGVSEHLARPAPAAARVVALPAAPRRRTWQRFAVAAAVTLLALPVAAYSGWQLGWVPNAHERYSADASARTVTLPDGSQVELNLGSQLTFSNYKDQRRVTLGKGEAFFKVSHDASHPFLVQAAEGQVRVTGTQFNVWMYEDQVRVTLLEGSVLVTSNKRLSGDGLRLEPGMQARYKAGDYAAQINPTAAVSSELAWRNGKLVLDNLALADALPLINRYLDSPLSLADSATGKLRIGGVFNTRQIDRLVSSLPKVLPVYLSRNAEGRTVLGTRPAL